MKPQQGLTLNRGPGTSRDHENASGWEWWEQMITQASKQNQQQRLRQITTEERTLLDRQSSVTRAQYDIAKHELLSNSSISVLQNVDIKLRNSKHRSEKPKRTKGRLKHDGNDEKSKEGSKALNECCSHCNLTTAYVGHFNKSQRHRIGAAHNLLEHSGCVELNTKSSELSLNYKCDKRKPGKVACLKAKPVLSDTMTNSLTNEFQPAMSNLRLEKGKLAKNSTACRKPIFKSKKTVKKYLQEVERTEIAKKQSHNENTAKLFIPAAHIPVSEKELNYSTYDSWLHFPQIYHEGNQLSETSTEELRSFLQYQFVSKPKNSLGNYRDELQKSTRRKGKPRYSGRKERNEARRRIELNHTKSMDSTEDSTLKEDYSNYSKNTILRKVPEVKSSLALNVACNKSNSIKFLEESQYETQQQGVSETNNEHLVKDTRKAGHVLKRCSCELKLYSDQSETESMIINVLNPTNQSANSELLSSLFESSDILVKRPHYQRRNATKSNSNNFTSSSALRAMNKEANTCLNIREEEYVSASSNLLVKPAVPNLRDVCEELEDETKVIKLNLEVASDKGYQNQDSVHLFDRTMNINDKFVDRRLSIYDSQSTIRYARGEQRGSTFIDKGMTSKVNISSLSLIRSQDLRKLPTIEAAIKKDFRTSTNLFHLKNMSTISIVLSSVTITENIRPAVCKRNRIIIPASTDVSEYLEPSETQPKTNFVLKSSSKISSFQSDSSYNFLLTQQRRVLMNSNSSDSDSNTSPRRLARASNALLSMESQMLRNIGIIQGKETVYEMQTLRKSPGKNALDDNATHSQFSRSFCTMNVQIPTKNVCCRKYSRDINNDVKETPRLSLLFPKKSSAHPGNVLKDDAYNGISKATRKTARRELTRVIKPVLSQKQLGPNLKRVKFQKHNRALLSKHSTLEKALLSNGRTTRHNQVSQSRLVRKDLVISPEKRNCFKDVGNNTTKVDFFTESKYAKHSQQEDSCVGHGNEIIISQNIKELEHRGEDNRAKFPIGIYYETDKTRLPHPKDKFKKRSGLFKLRSETVANKSWKSVFDMCVKTIKSMTNKKTTAANTILSTASQCYSKYRQWNQNCYFCTVSREIPQSSKLSATSNKNTNVGYQESKDDDNFIKKCSGTLNFHDNMKVPDVSDSKKIYNQEFNKNRNSDLVSQAKMIYQNPATYVYRTCDSYKKSGQYRNKLKNMGTKTDKSNISTVSTITSQPFYKSKSTQSLDISKVQNNVPHNKKTYKIETIYPLTSEKFNRSKSEIILLKSDNTTHRKSDELNIPNSLEDTRLYSVSNKSRTVKKRKEKSVPHKGIENVLKSSLSGLIILKRLLTRCKSLFKRNDKTESKTTATQVSKQFDKEAKTSFKSLKQRRKHKVLENDLKKSKSDGRRGSDCLLHSQKSKSFKVCQNHNLGEMRHQNKENSVQCQLGDFPSFASKISNKHTVHTPNSCYRQEYLCCGIAQIQPKAIAKKNKPNLVRDSLHKKHQVSRFHYLTDKIHSQKSMNEKKTNCQVAKRDVGTNCIRRKRFKHKTKCVQAELWDEKALLMMSGDKKSNCSSQYKAPVKKKRESPERKQKKCVQTPPIKKIDTIDCVLRKTEDNFTKGHKMEYTIKLPNKKNETKLTHLIAAKCKNLLKTTLPQTEQALDEEYSCYRFVDCNIARKHLRNNSKDVNTDYATNFKRVQTLPKVRKTKSIKARGLAKTAVKVLQVDSKRLLKEIGRINQDKQVVKPKVRNDRMKNQATVCDKPKRKNKSLKTADADPLLNCRSTSTDKISVPKVTITQRLLKKTTKNKKTLSPVKRSSSVSTFISKSMKSKGIRVMKPRHQKNTANAIEALLLQDSTKTSNAEVSVQGESSGAANKIESKTKQKKEKGNKKIKKEKMTQKKLNIKDKGSVSTTAKISKKIAAKIQAKQKQKKISAKTKSAVPFNKAVMTQNIIASSCCTNTTPSIGIRIGTKLKQKRYIMKRASVETKGVNVSSRSTNTTFSCDKNVEAKVYIRKKRKNDCEWRSLSCPTHSISSHFSCGRRVNAKIYRRKTGEQGEENIDLSCTRPIKARVRRTGISFKVKKDKTGGCMCLKQPPADCNCYKNGQPFIKGTQTRTKCKVMQINTTQDVAKPLKQGFPDCAPCKTKIYTTEDKQTSASSRCVPPLQLITEAPVNCPTMMTANKTKQVCCAFFTAGAWNNSKAAISRSNQASASTCKPILKNLQVMTAHGVTCNMDKQRKCTKCKHVNAISKENVKESKQQSNMPLSKSSPCCICGTSICEKCKEKIITNSIEKERKDKKPKKLKTKNLKDSNRNNYLTKQTTEQNVSLKVKKKVPSDTIKLINKTLAKEQKKMEKLNKKKSTQAAKEARRLEKRNKLENKRAAKQANEIKKNNNRKINNLAKQGKKVERINGQKHKIASKESKINKKKETGIKIEKKKVEKLNKKKNVSLSKDKKKAKSVSEKRNKSLPKEEKKKGKVLTLNYQSKTKDPPPRKDVKESKQKDMVQKRSISSNRSTREARVKTIRAPFPIFSRWRTQKKDPKDIECQELYKTHFRKRMVLFIYVRNCGYFVRTFFRRLLGCLFFVLGILIWTPCICCFECCRECLFCCCK